MKWLASGTPQGQTRSGGVGGGGEFSDTIGAQAESEQMSAGLETGDWRRDWVAWPYTSLI